MAGAWKVRELFKLNSTFDRINTNVQALLSPAVAALSICLALMYWQRSPWLSFVLLLPLSLLVVGSLVLDIALMGGKPPRGRVPHLVVMSALQFMQLRIPWASFSATIHGMSSMLCRQCSMRAQFHFLNAGDCVCACACVRAYACMHILSTMNFLFQRSTILASNHGHVI